MISRALERRRLRRAAEEEAARREQEAAWMAFWKLMHEAMKAADATKPPA